MAQEELNLVQFAASFTTQPCARATKIVGCQFVDSCSLGAILDDVPHDPLRDACSPGLARPANTSEHASPAYSGGLAPSVNGRLDPVGNRYCADVSAFADQVDDGSVILPLLNVRKLQFCGLSTAQPQPNRIPSKARSRLPFSVLGSGTCHNARACVAVSQLPRRTPRHFAPLTRRIPAARSGLSRPESAASYARRLTAASLPLIVFGAS